jgi:ferredoxin-NADP reductase
MSTPNPRSPRPNAGLRRFLGSRLAATLTYPHGVDRYLEQFNPTWSLHEVRAKLVEVRHGTDDSVTLTLRPNDNWQGFRAGQYVRLTVEINGVRRTRCYSPASSAHASDGLIELTAKAHADGFVSRFLNQQMAPGMVVTLSQAEGVFALPGSSMAGRPGRILLISGGSGITPVMSMLRTLLDEGHSGRISFLHYCNRVADMIYADELAQIAARHPNVDLIRAFAAPNQGGELAGLFSREQLLERVPDYAQAQTFLCGPPGMMKVVQQVFAEDGLNDQLHLEHFTAAPAVVDSANAEGEVRFARSERLAVNNGATLLDQAEGAGLNPESGCRMGICHTCTCRKTAGRVRDIRTGEISEAGEQDIQICISVPVGSVTLDI